jgi:hypothetical protein
MCSRQNNDNDTEDSKRRRTRSGLELEAEQRNSTPDSSDFLKNSSQRSRRSRSSARFLRLSLNKKIKLKAITRFGIFSRSETH